MAILDSIKELINEHGSADILRERITLAEDKYQELERKLAKETERAETAEQLVESLRIQLAGKQAEIDMLSGEFDAEDDDSDILEAETVLVLDYLRFGHGFSVSEIARETQLAEEKVNFHLEELRKRGMVKRIMKISENDYAWRLDQEGRRKLIDLGLMM